MSAWLFAFLFDLLRGSRKRADPTGRVLAYDSGRAAKLMRFPGVERPDEGELPLIRATPAPRNSGKLECDAAGDGGIDAVGVAGTELRFSDECVGGGWGFVEEEWRDFVSRRETDAVAVDVPEAATGMGDLGMNTGGFSCSGIIEDFCSTGAGCLSRIFCKADIVRCG